MTVAEMQERILELGWQFEEHVFNDGNPANCYVRFCRDRSPHVFGSYAVDCKDPQLRAAIEDIIGWGRFSRQYAWEQAYDRIMERERAAAAFILKEQWEHVCRSLDQGEGR
jgi:hypothetical protein